MTRGVLCLDVFAADLEQIPAAKYPDVPTWPHVTLQFNCEGEPFRDWLLDTVYVTLVEEYYNERVHGVRVSFEEDVLKLCKNEIPHLSISKTPEATFAEVGRAYSEATVVRLDPVVVKTILVFKPFSLMQPH